jgi:hypothetical protein
VAATLSKLAVTGVAGPRWTVTEACAWPLVAAKVKLRGLDHLQPCCAWRLSEHLAHEYMGWDLVELTLQGLGRPNGQMVARAEGTWGAFMKSTGPMGSVPRALSKLNTVPFELATQ